MACSLFKTLAQLSAVIVLHCGKVYRRLSQLTNDGHLWITVYNRTNDKVLPIATDDNRKTLLELEKSAVQTERLGEIWINKDALKTAPPLWYRTHFPPSQFPAQPVAMMGNYVILCENTGFLPTRFQWVSLPPPGPSQELTGEKYPLKQKEPGHVCFEYLIESPDAEYAHYLDYTSDTLQIAYLTSPGRGGSAGTEEPILHIVGFGCDAQGVPHVTTGYEIALFTGHTINTLTMDDRYICIYRVSPQEEIDSNLYLDIVDERTREVSQICLVVPKQESLRTQQKRVYIYDTYIVLVAWDKFAVFRRPNVDPEPAALASTVSPLKLYASFTGTLPTPYYKFLPCPTTTSSFALLNFDYENNSHSPNSRTKIRLFFVELLGARWYMNTVDCTEIPGTMQGRAMLSAIHREEESYYAFGAISSTFVNQELPSWGEIFGWARPTRALLGGRVESLYAIRVNLSQLEFGLGLNSTWGRLTVTKMHLAPCVDEGREHGYFVDMDPYRGRALVFVGPYDRSSPGSYSIAVLDYLSRR